jgi:drug/metabolite transporter (DMT)-like permease
VAQPTREANHSDGAIPLLAVATAALLWAIAATVARSLFDDGVEPIELVEARAVIAAAGLALVPGAWRGGWRGDGHPVRLVVLLGLAIALVNAAYYLAIARLAVAVAIVLQYTGPAIVVLWTSITRRKAPPPSIVGAVLLAFLGVVLVSELLAGDIGNLDGLGLLFGLGAAVMFATYTLQSEKAAGAYGSIGALSRSFAVSALLWIAFQIPRGVPTELIELDHLPAVLFVGVGGTLIPFLLYIWAVQAMRSQRAVIAATLEPLFAGLIAWIWLGQTLSAWQIIGASLILCGVAMLQLGRKDAVLAPEP